MPRISPCGCRPRTPRCAPCSRKCRQTCSMASEACWTSARVPAPRHGPPLLPVPSLVTAAQIDRSRALLDVGARLGAAALEDRRVDLDATRGGRASACASGRPRIWSSARTRSPNWRLARGPCSCAAAWRATSHALVLVEPGTPAGFQHILDARTALAAEGARFIAPCPHEGPCPMRTGARTDDWCHFSVRVPRTRRHRQLKGGSLGYEDEKFAYLVATRRAGSGRSGRRGCCGIPASRRAVSSWPCARRTAPSESWSRRRDAAWPAARKASWGDALAHRPG